MAFFVHLKYFGVIHGSVKPAFLIMRVVSRFRDYLKFSRYPYVPRGKEIIHCFLFLNKITKSLSLCGPLAHHISQ